MTLPTRLRPWWRYFKRAHRLLTRLCGMAFRPLSRLIGARGVPLRATSRSTLTAAGEPEAVTLHAGLPGAQVVRSPTCGEPSGHWAFQHPGPISIPATFTLEIRNGRLAGEFGAAITPGKVLDGETSTYFGVSDWREHPLFLRPTLGAVQHLPGTALSLTTRGVATNYYHFLYDAIGRYAVLEQSLPDTVIDSVIVPHRSRYQRELLALAGVTQPLVEPRPGRCLSADRLLVPSNPNWALHAPPSTVHWLRERLRPAGSTDAPRRLYLTRGNAPNSRRYVEEEQLWPHLERQGFLRLDPGRLSVQEQINVFHRAEVIVAPHGAGLTNVTFSEPEVRVLEMFPSTYVHLGLWSICQALGARYRYLVAAGPGEPGGPNAGVLDDVSIPVPTVLASLEELLA